MSTAHVRQLGTGQRLGEVVLTALAVVGATCLAALIAALVLDIRPIVFRSGSMAPAIPAGALALVRATPAAQLKPGDIVTVRGQGGIRITHRIVSVRSLGDQVELRLKGDANTTPDEMTYVVPGADRVIWSAPGMGRVVSITQSTPFVFLSGVALGAAGLAVLRPRRRQKGPHDTSGAVTSRRRFTSCAAPAASYAAAPRAPIVRVGSLGVALAIMATLGASKVDGVWALFSDDAYATATITRAANGQLVGWQGTNVAVLTNGYRAQAMGMTESSWSDVDAPPIGLSVVGGCANNAMGANSTKLTSRAFDGNTGVGAWGATYNVPITPKAISCYVDGSATRWIMTDGSVWRTSTNGGASWTAWNPPDAPSGVQFLGWSSISLIAATQTGVYTYNYAAPSPAWLPATGQSSYTSSIQAMAVSSNVVAVLAGGQWYQSNGTGGNLAPWSRGNDVFGPATPYLFTGGGMNRYISCTVDRVCTWLGAGGVNTRTYPRPDL